MKIFVKVKLRAKEPKVEKIDKTHFLVVVKEMPIEGKANAAVEKAIAKYFKTAASNVRIISGRTSRQKVVDVS